MRKSARHIGLALVLPLLFAAGCQVDDLSPKAEKQLPAELVSLMKSKGMSKSSPVMVRIFKEEGVLEIWKRKDTGRFDLVTNYEICKWSGRLGPKFMESDRQAPEGFYNVRPTQMNPRSRYHLAFNMGYPNTFDRAHGRTGAHLMVHGACSSAGCYSMTDEQVEEIFAFARDAFRGGQREFQIQAFPFRMTPENMARYRDDPNYAFWQNLKEGYDHFELTKVPPKVDVCEKRYVFNKIAAEGERFDPTGACPASTQPDKLRLAYQTLQSRHHSLFSTAIASGSVPAPQATIAGPKEAAVIAKWQNARKRGERVSRDAPYFSTPVIPQSSAPPPPRFEQPEPVVAALPDTEATPAAQSVSTETTIETVAAQPVVAVQPSVAPRPAVAPLPTPSPDTPAGAFPPAPDAPATAAAETPQTVAAQDPATAAQPSAERFAAPPPDPQLLQPETAPVTQDQAVQSGGQSGRTDSPLLGKKRPWWKLIGS